MSALSIDYSDPQKIKWEFEKLHKALVDRNTVLEAENARLLQEVKSLKPQVKHLEKQVRPNSFREKKKNQNRKQKQELAKKI